MSTLAACCQATTYNKKKEKEKETKEEEKEGSTHDHRLRPMRAMKS